MTPMTPRIEKALALAVEEMPTLAAQLSVAKLVEDMRLAGDSENLIVFILVDKLRDILFHRLGGG